MIISRVPNLSLIKNQVEYVNDIQTSHHLYLFYTHNINQKKLIHKLSYQNLRETKFFWWNNWFIYPSIDEMNKYQRRIEIKNQNELIKKGDRKSMGVCSLYIMKRKRKEWRLRWREVLHIEFKEFSQFWFPYL